MKLNNRQKAQFFHQLAALLKAGISLKRSLTMVGKEEGKAFQKYLQKVNLSLDMGKDFASALKVSGTYFDRWTISLLRIAEYSGTLVETCTILAEEAEAQQRRQRRYHSIRLSIVVTLWSILTLAAAIFNPNSTALIRPEFWIRSILIALFLFALSYWSSFFSQASFQQIFIKLPGMEEIIQAHSLLYFGQLRLPLSAGASVLSAVELLKENIPDSKMAKILTAASHKLRRGLSLSHSVEGKIPSIARQMIFTGEETGNLDAGLQHLTQHYEGELEYRLKMLQTSLKPVSIIAIGAVVGVATVRILKLVLSMLPG